MREKKKHTYTHLKARKAALMGLYAVFKGKTLPDYAFGASSTSLNPQDKAFAYSLLQTTLRYALWLDDLSTACMQKPFPPQSTQQQILRLGLCQLLLLGGVKPHAAVSTTVDLAKAEGLHKFSGVINGVLRHVQRKHAKTPITPDPLATLPSWLKTKLEAAYNPSQLRTLAQALLTPAPLDFCLYGAHIPQNAAPLAPLEKAYRLPSEVPPAALKEFLLKKEVYIQDHSAQWPAYLLTKHIKIEGPVLDMCAAPGGKTLQLLESMDGRSILAADINPKRLRLFNENTQHKKNKPLTVAANGAHLPLEEASLAGILLDAPCSATGTNRRHPEVLHLRSPQDVTALKALQQTMLHTATKHLKKGGVLVYAVCSLLPEEGEEQNIWLQENIKTLKPLPLNTPLPQNVGCIQPTQNALRLTPLGECGDGFYIALYEKI